MWLLLWLSEASSYSIRYALPLLIHEVVVEFALGLRSPGVQGHVPGAP
jgi:hypothetical protein